MSRTHNRTTVSLAVGIGFALLLAFPPSAVTQSSLPVFPGAEGFGTTTRAGRGGTVYRVTSLNDSGAGSLRAALMASGPRIVVFEISGTISLASTVTISNPYITIAGQTAPSPGITVRGATLRVATHDVLIQHLRIRVGDGGIVSNPDGVWVMDNAYRVVIDHCSISWAVDENVSVNAGAGANPYDVTISNSILSEGLSNSLNTRGEHSKGSLLRDRIHRVSVVRNLFAHNRERNPQIDGDTRVVIVNNINYNPGAAKGAIYFSNASLLSGPQLAAVVGNVMIPGADTPTPSTYKMIWIRDSAAIGSLLYVADNRGPGYSSTNPWAVVKNDAGSRVVATTAPLWTPLSVLSGAEVQNNVLANAGARPAERDAVDRRVVSDVTNRTGRIIDSQSQVGGWPSLAVNRRTLSLPANPNGDDNGDGYTNIEEWLHSAAASVEGRFMTAAPAAPSNVRVVN